MKQSTIANLAALVISTLTLLVQPGSGQAQVIADYQSTPPFVADVVPPNVLLILDNSGSMGGRACDATWCGVHSDGTLTPVNQSFVSTTTYSGYFDTTGCYTYDGANIRFDLVSTRASVSATCASTDWDGNFLNWATFRRFDALKKSMSGGDCVVTRNADGTCPPSGSPAKITIRAQSQFDNGACCLHHTTDAVPSGGANGYAGRVPTSATGGTPANIYVHLRGGTSGMQGSFCVDNDSTAPSNTANSCNDGDGFSETQYRLRVTRSGEPTGVIQQIGAKARFGLFEFKGSAEGARMLVGLGARQTVNWGGTGVETFNTNMAAMLDAIEESYPATWTPLSESLYEAARYIAQINSTMPGNTSYIYPIAFAGGNSNGVSLGATGIGSIGAGEISALTGTETCPAGYISNACGRDPYFYGSNHTPAWASTSSEVRCCKTFVIIVTDGEPTQDINVPAVLQDYAHGHHGQHCTGGSTTIHSPNGTCNTNAATPPSILLGEHKTDYASNGNHYLDDVAYWMHINDLRPDNGGTNPCGGSPPNIAVINTPGHCLGGFQNATVYTFFAFGNIAGRELLMHTARLGGFDDTNGNNVPDLPIEWDKFNNVDGTTGSTVPGCNADCIPDTYFESSNVDDLQERLLAALTSILRKSASGSSVSVLASSLTGDGALYQAYFYVSDVGTGGADVKWLGFTEGLFIDRYGNLREDTNQDGRLVLKDDMIITTRYEDNQSSINYGKVLVNKYLDADGDGVADSATPTLADQQLKDIAPIWEAGKRLALTPSASRNLVTWVDLNNNKVVDAGEQMALSTANSATLSPYIRATATGVTTANNIINFIRGDEISGMRTRMMDVQNGASIVPSVWKYGDPIHSPPTLVGVPHANFHLLYGDSSYLSFFQQYRNRRQVIYVGANDGMLHAFNAGYYHSGDDPTTPDIESGWFTKNPTDNSSGKALGEELWGYVPYELLPQLRFLTQSDYSHVYFVDLKPKVFDVQIFTPDADHPGGWGTILIGGFRMGGSCGQCASGTGAPPMTVNIGGTDRTFYSAYFVLDITNPETTPKVLMSFSDAGLGLTTGSPAIARVSPSTDVSTDPINAKWYMILGSGPNGYAADLSTGNQTAKLYVVDLKTGPGANNSLVTTMNIGSWKSFMSDVVATDRDLDYRVDMAYVGRTAHDGVLPWRGKLYRLSMKGCASGPCSPNTWGIANGAGRSPTEVLDTFLDKGGATLETGPIMAAPVVTLDDANENWVFFGTGRYYNASDKVNVDQQYLFGVKDSVAKGICTETSPTSCYDNDLVDVSDAVLCTSCASGNTNEITGVGAGPMDFNSMIALVQSKRGWFAKMKTVGERAIVPPTLVGGTIFFPTFVPTNDICASTGTSRLYAMYYKTGTAYKDPILGSTPDGAGNANANTSISLGSGLASSVVVQIIADPKGPGPSCPTPPCAPTNAMLFIHTDSGATLNQGVNLNGKPWSRYLTWLHQRD